MTARQRNVINIFNNKGGGGNALGKIILPYLEAGNKMVSKKAMWGRG